jgi:hypothetical protein
MNLDAIGSKCFSLVLKVALLLYVFDKLTMREVG